MQRFLLLAVLMVCAAAASARSVPPPLPGTVQAAEPNMVVVGSGTLTWFLFRVYDAWLWAPDGRWSADAPFVLDLRYARSLNGEQIAERSVIEIRRQSSIDESRLTGWGEAMKAVFPDVTEGDRLTGVFVPGGSTRFYFNGEFRAEVADPDFGPAFSGIWLAPQTSEPRLRRALLGL